MSATIGSVRAGLEMCLHLRGCGTASLAWMVQLRRSCGHSADWRLPCQQTGARNWRNRSGYPGQPRLIRDHRRLPYSHHIVSVHRQPLDGRVGHQRVLADVSVSPGFTRAQHPALGTLSAHRPRNTHAANRSPTRRATHILRRSGVAGGRNSTTSRPYLALSHTDSNKVQPWRAGFTREVSSASAGHRQ